MFSNHRMVPASLLLAFGLLIGGCGSGAPAETATGTNAGNSVASTQSAAQETNASTQEASKSEQPTTRVVSTAMGDVEVPAKPERVVTDYYLGHLLALGIKPVGTYGLFMQSPYLKGQIEGITDVSDNVEAILALNPDLIITGDAKKYDTFSKIAPTVLVAANSNVREEVKTIGHMVNKEAEADEWLTTFNKKIDPAKERISRILGEGDTVTVFAGGIMKLVTLYGNAYTGRTIYGELGMPMQEKVKRDIDPKVGWIDVSSEVITQYAGEHIFMAVDLKAESFDYKNDPIWGTLDAVKENRLYEIDGFQYYFSDPISIMGQVQDLADMMEERTIANKSR